LLEHLRALDDCTIEQEGKKKEGVLLKCGCRIAKLRPLLEETHKQMMTMAMMMTMSTKRVPRPRSFYLKSVQVD
jgi:hypothetical protein